MSIAEAKWQDAKPTLVPEDSYLNDFDLQYDPFLVAPNLLYLPSRWEQHLDLLQHLSHNNNLLLAIIGEPGIGKTMFLEQFVAETISNPIVTETDLTNKSLHKNFQLLSDDQHQICQVAGDTMLDQQCLLDLLIEGFNLTRQPTQNLQEQCEAIIEVLQQRPQRSLLIIDDAHLLPIGALQAILYLLNLQSDTKNHLQILLAGTENLRHNFHYLTDQHANTDIVCVLDLEPLTAIEAAQYLNHCFKQAGFVGETVFDDDEIAQIYNQSKGVPLQINHFARQLLIAAEQPLGEQKMNESIREFVEQHRTKLIGGGVLLLFIVVLMWSVLSSNTDKNNSAELVIDQSKVPAASVSETVAQQQQLAHPNSNEIAPNNPQAMAPAVATPSPQANAVTPNKADSVSAIADTTGVAMDDESMVPTATPTSAVASNSTVMNTAAAQAPVEAQPAVKATPLKLTPAHVNAVSAKSTSAAVTKKNTTKVAKTGYTLQLIGLSDKKRIESFVQSNHLQGKIDYVHSQKNGKDWYVVLYGHYSTAAQAKHAINTLPKGVQSLSPWVRNMNTVSNIQTAKSTHKATLKPAASTKLSATKNSTKVATVSKKSVTTAKNVTPKEAVKVASAASKIKTSASAPKQDNFVIDETIDG